MKKIKCKVIKKKDRSGFKKLTREYINSHSTTHKGGSY